LQLFIDRIDTPISGLLLAADAAGKLCALDWADYQARMLRLSAIALLKNGFAFVPARKSSWVPRQDRTILRGRLDITVDTAGTVFQRDVCTELRTIPCGSDISYGKPGATDPSSECRESRRPRERF
jgi:methylated-DNA-[protein]-cysteine S-methyltransferase